MPQARIPVSVIVLTFNEEDNIGDCLSSILDIAGEIWVVDSGSIDRTLEIAREYTENIVKHPFANYKDQRNWAQDELPLSYEWVVHLDADERATEEMKKSLLQFFGDPDHEKVNGMILSRRTIFMDRWIRHGGLYPSYHLRIFKRQLGYCENRLYDQHFLVSGNIATLEGDLINIINSDPGEWTTRHLIWAKGEAEEALSSNGLNPDGVKASLFGTPIERRRWHKNNLYYRLPLFVRPFLYFFYRYFIRLGILDGKEGLIYHFLHGLWYRFFVDSLIYARKKARK